MAKGFKATLIWSVQLLIVIVAASYVGYLTACAGHDACGSYSLSRGR
jgi:hypothetical protein